MKKRYRVEWMHNFNWRMDEDGSGTFATREEAEEYIRLSQKQSSGPLTTRIVEVA